MSTFYKVLLVILDYFAHQRMKFVDHPDAGLSIERYLGKYDYPLEKHTIITQDGYHLMAHRIPHGHNSNGTNRYPIVFVHGTCGAGELFLLPGFGKGLAWYLVERNFDIWLLNTRGNYHSRKHSTLNPDVDYQYWDFSWHEVGVYDLPASIDYILNVTKRTKLFYVGHSQGSTEYLVLTTQRPEYNDKIALGINLAPSAFLGDGKYVVAKIISKYRRLFKMVMQAFNFHEIFPYNSNPYIRATLRYICSEVNTFVDVCNFIFNFPEDSLRVDPETFQLVFTYVPAGCSVKQLLHYIQVMETSLFGLYDYGPKRNKKLYGVTVPPLYLIENITAPTAYFYGARDIVTKPEGIGQLISRTKRSEVLKIDETFSHVDFLFARDVTQVINEPLYRTIRKYTSLVH